MHRRWWPGLASNRRSSHRAGDYIGRSRPPRRGATAEGANRGNARPPGKPANVVTTAIARELAGFVWDIARHVMRGALSGDNG